MSRLKYLLTAVLCTLVANVGLTSCLDEKEDIAADPDCYATVISLGKLKQRIDFHSSRTDRDTFFIDNLDCSAYPLTIDQIGGHIYNADSLPYGVDVSRVVFSKLSCVGGTFAIQRLTSFEDTTFVATDSTDFTYPRLVTIYGRDQVSRRRYTMDIRAHKEHPDSMKWQRYGQSDDLAAMTALNAQSLQEGVVCFGMKDGKAVCYADGVCTALGADLMTRSIRACRGALYGLTGAGVLMTSADGHAWQEVSGAVRLQYLLGSSSVALYAIDEGGRLVSSADGAAWTAEPIEEQYPLPTAEIAVLAKQKTTDLALEDVLLVGQRDGAPCVWKRTIDHSGHYTMPWTYMPQGSDNTLPMPVLRQPSVMGYADGALLIATGVNADTIAAPRLSADFGRTWTKGKIPALRSAAATPAVAATVDAAQYVWVFCQGSGEIWRARLNRLGWQETQTAFTKAKKR